MVLNNLRAQVITPESLRSFGFFFIILSRLKGKCYGVSSTDVPLKSHSSLTSKPRTVGTQVQVQSVYNDPFGEVEKDEGKGVESCPCRGGNTCRPRSSVGHQYRPPETSTCQSYKRDTQEGTGQTQPGSQETHLQVVQAITRKDGTPATTEYGPERNRGHRGPTQPV